MEAFDNSNSIFQAAASFINHTSKHVFLTGKAGTGKTTFLRYIKDHSFKKMVVVAPTGVAAINAGGVTIHSLFQLPPGTFLLSDQNIPHNSDGLFHNHHTLFANIKMRAEKRDLLREIDLLVIDEISMVRADLLDAIDAVLRHFRKKPMVPFGGVQVLYIGDLFQLPPVVSNREWNVLKEHYRSPFFFDAKVIEETTPLYIELKKIYRQTDDHFIGILNNVRNNCCLQSDLEHLNNYFDPHFETTAEKNFITLTTHNAKADSKNIEELRKLPGASHFFEAKVSGEFNIKSYPADEVLELKEGAQVMFIKNDTGDNRKYFNGKLGTVDSFEEDKIIISCPGETEKLELERETWKNIRYVLNKEENRVEEEELGTFSQFPLRLAWAITIHKSQGLTFRNAVIDAGESFAPGQVYVALSRLTSLDGLILKSKIPLSSINTDQRVLDFVGNELPEDELQDTLHTEQQNFSRQTIINGFNLSDVISKFQIHYEGYETRELPDIEKCILLFEDLIAAFQALNETANKFQIQLSGLFENIDEPDFTYICERVDAGIKYFTQEIDTRVIEPLQAHIKYASSLKRVKRYKKELEFLVSLVNRKKQQFVSMKGILKALYQSNGDTDIVSAMSSYFQPVVPTNEESIKNTRGKLVKGQTQKLSLGMFKEGKSIPEIAKQRELAVSTIESHLTSFLITGEIAITDLVKEQNLERIYDIIETNPSFTLTEIKSVLGDEFSWGEIRAAMESKRIMEEKRTDQISP